MATASGIRAGRAYIELSLSDDQFKKSLQNAERRLQNVGKSIAAAGTKIAAFGLAGISAFVPAIKAASDFQETMSKFDTVFGDASESVKAFGESLAGELGRSKSQILQFLASSQDLFVPLGFDAATAQELSKTITRLSVDLASFNNIADDDAMRDLQAALTGSGEVMKKYGVIVSEAAVKQQLFNQGIDPKSASEQEKVMARLSIILAGTSAAQGDAARTSDGFANQMKRLQGNVIDVAVSIGEALLPALTGIVAQINGAADKISAWVGENGKLVATLAVAAVAVTTVGTALAGLGVVISLAGSAVGTLSAGLAAMGGIATVAGVAVGAMFAPLTLIAGAIGAVIYLIGGWDAVIATVKALGSAVAYVGKLIGGAFVGLFEEIAPAMSRVLAFIRSGFQTMANVVLGVIAQIAGAIDFIFRTELRQRIDDAMNRLAQLQASQNAASTAQQTTEDAQQAASANAQQAQAAQTMADAVAEAQAAYAAAPRTTTRNQEQSGAAIVDSQEGMVAAIAEATRAVATAQESAGEMKKETRDRYADLEVNRSLQVKARNPRELLELQRAQERFAAEQTKAETERLNQLSGLQDGIAESAQQTPSAIAQFGGQRAEAIFGNVADRQLDVAKKQLDVSQQALEENKRISRAMEAGGLAFG